MKSKEAQSFCRICSAGCGVRLVIDKNGRIARTRGDKDHPMTKGYICFKGIQADENHHNPKRLLHSLKRMPDGNFAQIALEDALDEIAEKLRATLDTYGPEAVATFLGNGGIFNKSTHLMLPAWLQAIGSSGYYTTMTIDQPAKMVTALRLGAWAAGKNPVDQSDVLMFVGNNPLVSHTSAGAINVDPTKTIKRETARGMKIIVIDPRLTETARYADVFLQPYPGEDPSVLAGLLRLILANGWEDKEFCEKHIATGHLQQLRKAVEPFSPEYVEKRSGIKKGSLFDAAKLFAYTCRKGAAFDATGPSMAPHSNLSTHLVECINVICGRFRRVGDSYTDIPVWEPGVERYAEVIPPNRTWEQMPPSRINGAGSLFGEKLSATLSDEILTPGPGQIKCLLNSGGNIAISMPDQRKMHKALKSLDLLVTIDPFMTATAKLSHYVIAPKMQYERSDLPFGLLGFPIFPVSWGQFATPVINPPEGSEVVDDWYVYWGLAKRLGMEIEFAGQVLDMETPPETDELLRIFTRNALVSLEEMKKYPGGKVFDVGDRVVKPARPEANGHFDVIPKDVEDELMAIANEPIIEQGVSSNGQFFSHRLAVRRIRNVYNTEAIHLNSTKQQYPYNPAWLNPNDLETFGFKTGDEVYLVSDHDRIPAILESDETVREGVISMSHGFGELPEESSGYELVGSNTNILVSTDRDIEPISSMPRMSAIPVNIVPRE